MSSPSNALARPLRVFLGSTSVDLEPYRTRVASLVRRLGQFAAVMDDFPLRPSFDATSVSLEELRASDLYLLLLAWRYGHVPAGQGLSVTHQEYREARRLGLPCFAFLADDATDKNPTLFPGEVRDPEHREQLLAFRAEVRQQLVATFTSMEDLADRVAAALHQYLLDVGRTPRLPRDLQPRVPGFVGREEELGRLEATLRRGQSVGRSALVAGLGGVGKSARASEAVHRLAADPAAFPGGITWMRSDGRTGLEGLGWAYDQVLSAWGLRPSPDDLRGASTPEAEAEAREGLLRARLHPPGPALALLDNVEPDFPLGRALERLAAQGLTLLVTARHRPALPGLRLVDLDVLDAEAAVGLFAERYADRGGRWEPDTDRAAAVAVVERLGRLPLAIELAASRAALTGAGVGGLAEELRGPDALERLRDPLDAEAGVRYSFGRSLALLSPAQRVRFAALGLPDGPDWPRPVVEALFAAVPPAGDMGEAGPAGADLERLAALSLVGLATPAAGGAPRVRVHPLLRELAAEEWGRQPAAVSAAGLVGLMAGVRAWAQAHQGVDAQTFAALEEDEALLVGALRRAEAAGVALGAVVDTAGALTGYLNQGGHWRAGAEVWTLALQAARRTGQRWDEGACLTNLGILHRELGEVEQAHGCYEQALAIAREGGDRQGESAALGNLGTLAHVQGDYAHARHSYERALAIDRQRGDRAGEAVDLTNLGILACEQGEYQQARRGYEQALAIARAMGDRALEADVLGDVGELALAAGDLAEAHRYLDQALSVARDAGHRNAECSILVEMGKLARVGGRREDARRLLEEAGAMARSLGSRAREARVLGEMARVLRDQGQPKAARPQFEQALAIFEAIGQAQSFEARKVRAELAALGAPQRAAAPGPVARPGRGWWPWRR